VSEKAPSKAELKLDDKVTTFTPIAVDQMLGLDQRRLATDASIQPSMEGCQPAAVHCGALVRDGGNHASREGLGPPSMNGDDQVTLQGASLGH